MNSFASRSSTLGKRSTLKDCPVCRENGCTGWSSGLVSCTTIRDGRKGDLLDGYQFIKTDRSGLGLWRPYVEKRDNAKVGHRLTKNEIELLKASRAKAKPAPKKRNLQKLDQQLRSWSFEKGLSDLHRQENLIRRGLTADQIDTLIMQGLVWDVDWGDNPDHRDLPGKWDVGRTGYSGAKGMAIGCQIYTDDSDEPLIAGAQILTEKAFRDSGNGKYLWLSTPENSSNIEQLGGGSPITVHRTSDTEAKHITVTEGILKPLIAFHRAADHGIDLGAAVIGAAGTIWGEDKTFCQIQKQVELLGVREIHLALDAGGSQNKNVMTAAAKFSYRCFKAGLEFKIIWYGQLEKSDGDIDELSVPVAYELLTLGEVQALEQAAAKLRPESKTDKGKAYAGPVPEQAAKCPLTASEGYERDFGYLPNHTGELAAAIFEHKISCIWAGKGTGKTQLAKRLVEIAHGQSRPVFLFVHRLRLGESLGSLFGLPLKYERFEMGDYLGFAITVDSAYPRSGMKFTGNSIPSNALVIVDEVDQVFWHMVSAETTIKSHRDEVIEEVSRAMARAENVLLLSADLADREADLVQKVCGVGEAQCLRIVNTHQRDLGNMLRYSDPYEIVFSMEQCLEQGGRFISKVSGQRDDSVTGTQTLRAMLKAKFPNKKGVVLDSETLKRLAVPVTLDSGKVVQVPMLEYITPADDALKAKRQQYYFGDIDYLLFTSACSTGISFEAGGFTDFFQLEQGKGPILDALQATARYRPTNIRRHVFVRPKGLDSIGNGATEPNKLSAGKDRAWARQRQMIANVGGDWLPADPMEYLSPLSHIWSNYSTIRAAEFNQQKHEYEDSFYAAAEAEGYKLAIGFNGTWQAMSPKERQAYKDEVKGYRDRNFEQKNQAEASEDVEGADLTALNKKRVTTEKEDRQIIKLTCSSRYGVDPDEVTAEMVAANKQGVYQRLLMRLYLEQGLEATAKRDKAMAAAKLSKGRMWAIDLLKSSSGHKVELLAQIGIPKLLEHLQKTDDQGQRLTVSKNSPIVLAVVDAAKELRADIKQSLGCTVGSVQSIFEDGRRREWVEVAKPITLIQTLLKKLELNLVKSGKPRNVDGETVRFFELSDLLIPKEGSPAIDYERFKIARLDQDDELKKAELPDPIFASGYSDKVTKIEKPVFGGEILSNPDTVKDTAENTPFEKVTKTLIDLSNRSLSNLENSDTNIPLSLSDEAGGAAPVTETTIEPEYIEVESPDFYRWGSSLSQWQKISQPNAVGQIYILSQFGVQMIAHVDELEPWRELVRA